MPGAVRDMAAASVSPWFTLGSMPTILEVVANPSPLTSLPIHLGVGGNPHDWLEKGPLSWGQGGMGG